MTEFIVLECKLKKDTPDLTFVAGERRFKGVKFNIKKPGEGVQKNVEKLCDVKIVKITETDEIETKELAKKNIKHDPELLQFAMDSWDLALKYEAEIAELKTGNTPIKEEAQKTEPKNQISKKRSRAQKKGK